MQGQLWFIVIWTQAYRWEYVSLAFYRLKVHPLAEIPGPNLARITNFYAVYHAYVGDIHLDIYAQVSSGVWYDSLLLWNLG